MIVLHLKTFGLFAFTFPNYAASLKTGDSVQV
jgi:hypothetical protein